MNDYFGIERQITTIQKEWARVSALLFLVGVVLGIVAGIFIHDFLYHNGTH